PRGPRPPPARAVLVGGGPEEGRLRDEAERLGIGPRVHCLGVRGDAAAGLKASDVFVLPSLEEGFPVSLLEAMACARPGVASAVGGVPPPPPPRADGPRVPPRGRGGGRGYRGGARRPGRGAGARRGRAEDRRGVAQPRPRGLDARAPLRGPPSGSRDRARRGLRRA